MTIRETSLSKDVRASFHRVIKGGFILGWDFILSVFCMATLIILALPGKKIPGLAEIRLAIGVIFIFFVPGYWFQAVLFPWISDINAIERIGISLGLSVAVISLLALLLDLLPLGLRLWPILISEMGTTLLIALFATWQRMHLGVGQAYSIELYWRQNLCLKSQLGFERGILIFFAIILILPGVPLAWNIFASPPDSFMTEFYILNQEQKAENFPRSALPGETLQVYMGITNIEREERTYTVEVWVKDPWNPDHRILVKTYGPFSLRRGQTIEFPVKWEIPWAGQDMRVDFLLFLENQTEEPYRALRLFLDVGKNTPPDLMPGD